MITARPIRKIVLLTTWVVLATGVMAFAPPPPPISGGPFSLTTDCTAAGNFLISNLGNHEFDLTDITIANGTESEQYVSLTNTAIPLDTSPGSGTLGVQYWVGGGSTLTQKFETPIRFTSPGPQLGCSFAVRGVYPLIPVSIQGIIK